MGAHLMHGSRRADVLARLTMGALGTLACALAGTVAPAEAAPSASAPEGMTLVSQAPAFVSSQNGVNLGIDVSSGLPASKLSIEVTLYSAIVYRSTLRQTLAGSLPSLLSPLGNPGVIPLDLRSLAWANGKEVTLHLPVSAPDLPAPVRVGGGTGGVSLSIFNCAPPTCGGVYPLQVTLLQEGVGPLASFTTYLIVTPPSEVVGTHPLQFAWVMPIGSTPAISPAGAPEPDASDLGELATLSSALATAPKAAVSLEVFPQFVEALKDGSGSSSRTAISELRSLASSGRVAVIPGPFVPVDLEAVVASGLPGALPAQLARSRQVLRAELHFYPHEYAANGLLDKAALALLAQSGITRVILPNASLQQLGAPFSQYTPTAPFVIPGSGVEAIASDPSLEEDIAASTSPALKAQQMLADLSVQYFDNSGAHQGVAVESAVGAQLNGTFLQAVLAGLSQSSIVHAVTLADIFDTVAPGSSVTSPESRPLSAASPSASALLPVKELKRAQADLAAVGSVLPATLHANGRAPLGDLVLMAEASDESVNERHAYLETITERAKSLTRLVSLPLGRAITMTSLQAKVPISIVSNAHSAFFAQLSVASPALGFPGGVTWRLRIYPRTNIVPILLSTRTSGNFSLQLRLTTTTGFTIESGSMTIRSTAISGVAVALSVGAVAFLLIWWFRSILAKRRKKHRLRGATLARDAIAGNAPGA